MPTGLLDICLCLVELYCISRLSLGFVFGIEDSDEECKRAQLEFYIASHGGCNIFLQAQVDASFQMIKTEGSDLSILNQEQNSKQASCGEISELWAASGPSEREDHARSVRRINTSPGRSSGSTRIPTMYND